MTSRSKRKGPPLSIRATVVAASVGRAASATIGRLLGSVSPSRPPPEKPPWFSAQVSTARASTATRPSQSRPRAGVGSEAHGLRTPLGLGAAVLPQRVDRPARQVVVEEQPGDALAVVVPAVVEHRQQPGESLDDQVVVVEERRGHLRPGTGRRYGGRQLVHLD